MASLTPQPKDTCPFCLRIQHGEFKASSSRAVCFEPLNPVSPGHMLFVPMRHYNPKDRYQLSHGMTDVSFLLDLYISSLRGNTAEDFNIVINAGSDATQTIEHMHVHLVPRRRDDGLLLPWSMQDLETREKFVGDIAGAVLNEVADDIVKKPKTSYSKKELVAWLRWTGTFIKKGRK